MSTNYNVDEDRLEDLSQPISTVGDDQTTLIVISNNLNGKFNIAQDARAYQYVTENGTQIVFKSKNRSSQLETITKPADHIGNHGEESIVLQQYEAYNSY